MKELKDNIIKFVEKKYLGKHSVKLEVDVNVNSKKVNVRKVEREKGEEL